jgi:hypothetical protein
MDAIVSLHLDQRIGHRFDIGVLNLPQRGHSSWLIRASIRIGRPTLWPPERAEV